jgi:hypothetical protein
VFEENDIEIVTPTSLQIPISFKEGEISLFSHSDLDATNELLDKFVDDFVIPSTKRVLWWEEDQTVNIGTITIVDGIPELHYVSIEVGK